METLLQDLRFGLRTLLKSPGFTAVAVLSLALGIGANTTIFSLMNAVFLKPLAVEEPSRLVSMYTLDPKTPGFLACSHPNYKDYRDRNQVFSGLLLYLSIPLTLTGRGEPQPLVGQIVSGNYFSVLGAKFALGRGFLPEEDQAPGAHPVVVVSYGMWTRRLGSDPHLLGKTLTINDRPFTVVGVAPQDFRGTNNLTTPEVWVPLMMYEQVFPNVSWFNVRRALLFMAIGRLKPGISQVQAEVAMKTLARQLEQQYPEDNEGRTVTLVPLAEATVHPNVRGQFLRAGGLILSVVGLVLFIACANVASLLLTRALGRRKEIAIRLAIGAGRSRLVAQLLTEAMLLSLTGGALGLVLAQVAKDLLWAARPPIFTPSGIPIALDTRVLAFTLLLSLATGLGFGLVPALQATRADLVTELKERTSQFTGVRSRANPRNLLVVLQVAFSFVALVGAGLFLRSLRYAQQIDPGFDTAHLSVLSFNLRTRGYSEARGREFDRQVLERVQSLPGVRSAALASNAPFSNVLARTVLIDGRETTLSGKGPLPLINSVDTSYFQTAGIPILKGRNFSDHDGTNAPKVVIINETMANRYWPREDPLGKRIRFVGENAPQEVVGVARDSSYASLGELARAFVYLPLLQNYSGGITLYARTAGDPAAILGAMHREVQALDPNLLLVHVETVAQVIGNSLWAPRMGALLLSIFGVLALALATIGIYGVISYSVSQRIREIGIRMALGARSTDVLKQILGEAMRLIAGGVIIGVAAALAVTRILASLLFGVSATDAVTFAGVAAVLGIVALAACYLPARKATGVDPTVALRYE